jgi:hypothetical protein
MKKIFFLMLLALPTAAQDAGDGDSSPGGPQQPVSVPIDGGSSLLLATGVAFGLRNLRRQRPHA